MKESNDKRRRIEIARKRMQEKKNSLKNRKRKTEQTKKERADWRGRKYYFGIEQHNFSGQWKSTHRDVVSLRLMFFLCSGCWAINEQWVRDKRQPYVYNVKRKQITALILRFLLFIMCWWQRALWDGCWKHYCIDVQNYFSLPSFTSVVCHLKLSH